MLIQVFFPVISTLPVALKFFFLSSSKLNIDTSFCSCVIIQLSGPCGPLHAPTFKLSLKLFALPWTLLLPPCCFSKPVSPLSSSLIANSCKSPQSSQPDSPCSESQLYTQEVLNSIFCLAVWYPFIFLICSSFFAQESNIPNQTVS